MSAAATSARDQLILAAITQPTTVDRFAAVQDEMRVAVLVAALRPYMLSARPIIPHQRGPLSHPAAYELGRKAREAARADYLRRNRRD